jgi:hypothetical protein
VLDGGRVGTAVAGWTSAYAPGFDIHRSDHDTVPDRDRRRLRQVPCRFGVSAEVRDRRRAEGGCRADGGGAEEKEVATATSAEPQEAPLQTLDEMRDRRLLTATQHAEIGAWIARARTPEAIRQMPPALWRTLELASVLMNVDADLMQPPLLSAGPDSG